MFGLIIKDYTAETGQESDAGEIPAIAEVNENASGDEEVGGTADGEDGNGYK